MRVCVYVYVHVYVHVHVHVRVHVCGYAGCCGGHVHVLVYAHVLVCVYEQVCVHVYEYVVGVGKASGKGMRMAVRRRTCGRRSSWCRGRACGGSRY